MRTLSAFRKGRGNSQEEFGKKLGLSQATYQSYESGRTSIPEDVQAKIRKLGYQGPWPKDEAHEAKAPAGDFTPREDYWKLVGRVEALERLVQNLSEGYQAHILKEPGKAHPQESQR